jgi:hypothetical protein
MSQCPFYIQVGADFHRRRYAATFAAAEQQARDRIVHDGAGNVAVWRRGEGAPLAVVHRDAGGRLWTEILIDGAAA